MSTNGYRWMRASFSIALVLLRGVAAERTQASWYGDEYRGKTMANGKPYDPGAMTCASRDYPLGTRLRVWTDGGKPVTVTVTDRGPALPLWRRGRRLDLSEAAFEKICRLDIGIVVVNMEVDKKESRKGN